MEMAPWLHGLTFFGFWEWDGVGQIITDSGGPPAPHRHPLRVTPTQRSKSGQEARTGVIHKSGDNWPSKAVHAKWKSFGFRGNAVPRLACSSCQEALKASKSELTFCHGCNGPRNSGSIKRDRPRKGPGWLKTSQKWGLPWFVEIPRSAPVTKAEASHFFGTNFWQQHRERCQKGLENQQSQTSHRKMSPPAVGKTSKYLTKSSPTIDVDASSPANSRARGRRKAAGLDQYASLIPKRWSKAWNVPRPWWPGKALQLCA